MKDMKELHVVGKVTSWTFRCGTDEVVVSWHRARCASVDAVVNSSIELAPVLVSGHISLKIAQSMAMGFLMSAKKIQERRDSETITN